MDRDFMTKFREAASKKDVSIQTMLILKNYEQCQWKQSWCLTENFCPDCKFNGEALEK